MMDINNTQNNICIVSIDVDSVFSKEFCDALFSYVMSCVHDEDMSGDILQDTMVSAIKNLHTVRNPDRIKQWIWKICKNKIREHKNSQKRYYKRYVSLNVRSQDTLFESLYTEGAEETALKGMNYADILQEVRNLKPPLNKIIYLRSHGYTFMQIGIRLGIPESTVKSRYFRFVNGKRKDVE